jgi:hypothetical protein
MATRIVEWKKPYTWWEAIEVTKDKVINLRLRDENNLIIYDEWDDEIYVDLQLEDGIEPTDAFPVWITTGRVLVADDWDKTWTLISAKTTSGDNIQLLYADDGTLWIDNWTWTFKQVYLSTDIAAILADYATKDYVDAHDTVISSSEPEEPYEWMLWYNTTNDKLKVYNWTSWQDIGSWWWADIEYVTQAEYDALPSSKLTDGKHYFVYSISGGGWWWQPWVNTTLYLPLDWDSTDPYNNVTYSWVGTADYDDWDTWVQAWKFNGNNAVALWASTDFENSTWELTYCFWFTTSSPSTEQRCSFNVSWKYFNMCRITGSKLWCMCSTDQQQYFATWTTTITADTKHLATITMKENDTIKVYLDGVLEDTVSISWTFTALTYQRWQHVWSWRDAISEFWYGMIKDFIIENKVWTAQEVADYFDQTKANYWIS